MGVQPELTLPTLLAAPMMNEIASLCRRHHVRTLDVFGSITTSHFDPARSDVDVLVDFEDLPGGGQADIYFELHASLEAVFARPVDLLTDRSIENPYLLRSIEQTRQRLYPRP